MSEKQSKPRSVEEIFKDSKDEDLREFALRITSLKKEAVDKIGDALLKTSISVLPLGTGGLLIAEAFNTYKTTDVTNYSIWGAILIFGGYQGFQSGLKELGYSAQARGEAQALTTVLTSYLIAEK